MKSCYSPLHLVSFLALLGWAPDALLADDCSEILKQGIFDYRKQATDSELIDKTIDWMSSSDASSYAETKEKANSFGLKIPGIGGIGWGGNSGQSKNYSSSREVASYLNSNKQARNNFLSEVRAANKEFIKAWTKCKDRARTGTFAWIERSLGDRARATLYVRMVPRVSDHPSQRSLTIAAQEATLNVGPEIVVGPNERAIPVKLTDPPKGASFSLTARPSDPGGADYDFVCEIGGVSPEPPPATIQDKLRVALETADGLLFASRQVNNSLSASEDSKAEEQFRIFAKVRDQLQASQVPGFFVQLHLPAADYKKFEKVWLTLESGAAPPSGTEVRPDDKLYRFRANDAITGVFLLINQMRQLVPKNSRTP